MTNLKTSLGATMWVAVSAVLMLATFEPVAVTAQPAETAASLASQAAV